VFGTVARATVPITIVHPPADRERR